MLSDIHEIVKYKADFFKRFGFNISDVDTFKGSLIQHSIDRDIEKTKAWQRVCLSNPTTKTTDKPTDEKEHRTDNRRS